MSDPTTPGAAPEDPTPPAPPSGAPYGAPSGYPGAAPDPDASAPAAPESPYGAPAAPGYTPQQPYAAAQPGYPAQQPYGAAPPYPAPGYGGYPVGPKYNVLAIISMIASIVGALWIVPFLGALAGVIMGHISLRQIARTGERGRGMALAGVIVGWVALGLFVLFVAFIVVSAVLAAASSSRFG